MSNFERGLWASGVWVDQTSSPRQTGNQKQPSVLSSLEISPLDYGINSFRARCGEVAPVLHLRPGMGARSGSCADLAEAARAAEEAEHILGPAEEAEAHGGQSDDGEQSDWHCGGEPLGNGHSARSQVDLSAAVQAVLSGQGVLGYPAAAGEEAAAAAFGFGERRHNTAPADSESDRRPSQHLDPFCGKSRFDAVKNASTLFNAASSSADDAGTMLPCPVMPCG